MNPRSHYNSTLIKVALQPLSGPTLGWQCFSNFGAVSAPCEVFIEVDSKEFELIAIVGFFV
jgi:hypothetical protein